MSGTLGPINQANIGKVNPGGTFTLAFLIANELTNHIPDIPDILSPDIRRFAVIVRRYVS